MLISHSEPILPLGIFRYPKGKESSYSMLVSLEAAQELDFRSPHYGVSKSFCDDKGEMSNRLPFVITNPPKDLELLETDLLFVLGRPMPVPGIPQEMMSGDDLMMDVFDDEDQEEDEVVVSRL